MSTVGVCCYTRRVDGRISINAQVPADSTGTGNRNINVDITSGKCIDDVLVSARASTSLQTALQTSFQTVSTVAARQRLLAATERATGGNVKGNETDSTAFATHIAYTAFSPRRRQSTDIVNSVTALRCCVRYFHLFLQRASTPTSSQ